MPTAITNSAIIRFLRDKDHGTGFVDSLKIKYRSIFSPFISLLEMVKPGEKVGDVGCGSGQFLLLVSHFAKPSYLFGIEINQRLNDNANKLFKEQAADSYNFTLYDGKNFPARLAEMDVIFFIDVLHHLPKKNQEAFIKNLCAVLKPGARLVLKDIDDASPLVYANKLHDIIFSREIGNEMTMQRAKKMLQDNGLEIIQEEKRTMYVYAHYTLVAKKQEG